MRKMRRTMLSALVLTAVAGLMVLVGWAAGPLAATSTGIQELSARETPVQVRPEPPKMLLTGVPTRLPAPRVEPDELAATFNRTGAPVLNHNAINRSACRLTESSFNFFPEVAAAQCKRPVLTTTGLRDVVLTRSANNAAVTVICRSGGGWLDVRASSPSYGEIEGIVAADAVDLRGAAPETCSS